MSFIKFLGTAGARFVMIKQLRSSGGIWLNYRHTHMMIDPGPGALVRCNSARPKLDPSALDAILLTHKHLDHAGDVNAMIEAMTEGGFKKRGVIFLPADALGQDGVILTYLKDFPEQTILLKKGKFCVGDISFEVPVRNDHPCETYGIKFFIGDTIVSLVADTDYFRELIDIYQGSTVLILNVVFHQRRDDIKHLCLEEAVELIQEIKPRQTIITHFGMSMLKAKPYLLEKQLKKQLETDIIFARDGMTLELSLK